MTLHYIDPGIDTGDIISQREVAAVATETGGSLYRKLEQASLELFQETWPSLCAGRITGQQPKEAGTFHRAGDVARIDEIELDRNYSARDLINILRSRTFPPYPAAFFREDGRKIYLRLELEEDGKQDN